MPNRIIKESVCGSETVDALSWFEEVFFYRLIVNCDDYGRMDARPAILRSRLFPLKNVTDKQVMSALQSLRSVGIVDLYDVDGRPFLQIRTWEKHQVIRAKKSKYPSPVGDLKASEIICNQMQANVSVIQSESESESESNAREARAREEETPVFKKPTVEEVREYCKARQNGIDARQFVDHYDANGWVIGKTKMKDWRAAIRTWENNGINQKKEGCRSSFDADEFFEAALKRTYGDSWNMCEEYAKKETEKK